MPKRKRSGYKKRTRKRYRRTRKWKLSSMRAPSGMPVQNIVKQRYCQHISIAGAGSITPIFHVFRAGSTFDPDVTGTGAQPMGHDQMAELYNRYRVLGSKITIKWAGFAAGSGNDHMVGVYLEDDASFPYISWEGIREAKKGTSQLVTHQRNAVTTSAKYSAKKFWDIKDVKDDATLSALTTANPSKNAHFIMWVQRLNKGVNDQVFDCMVQIDYIVQYFEPKELDRS